MRRELQRRDPDQRPPAFEPDLFRARFALLRREDHLTDAHRKHLETLFEAYPRLRTAWDALQELYRLYEADDLDGANQALARFADLYDTGQIPEYHDVVDTIISWGEEILAYHNSGRASNGPIEEINNLLQVLRRVAHGSGGRHRPSREGGGCGGGRDAVLASGPLADEAVVHLCR
ncbi:ISL3 family transposase [Candidatus Spongiisocius sp.]|uniref:ISL3 family transposase n=1 Tax=Candidatus Spongiisocius sp. TaxID=3101273 RepID=UPI003B5C0758